MVTDPRPPETVSEPETEVSADLASAEASVLVTGAHTPSVHEALLETVSADALEAGAGPHESAGPAETQAAEAPETADAADEAEPAPVMQPPEALEAASDALPLPDVTPEVEPEPEAVTAVEAIPEPVSVAAIETASVALVATPAPEAILRPTGISFDMIGEITQVNATILAFLQSEGSAAMAHWHSLSGARTPADAIRIQVDEMQRAADASLTCFSVLARRAGRLAAEIGRA